jgi:mycothiol system anti-sigma-R factor
MSDRTETITCKEFVDFLMAYLDRELSGVQRSTFEDHLDECPPCKNYLDSYRETVALGRGCCAPDDAPVPEDVPEALVKAILAARKA